MEKLSGPSRNSDCIFTFSLLHFTFWQVVVFFPLFFLSIAVFIPTNQVFAQERTGLTITPPLQKNNVAPGQYWRSAIKVVNNGGEPTDVYVTVYDFTGGSEQGQARFLPPAASGSPALASGWVDMERGPVALSAYGSRDIPFIVAVPEGATPGGHYVAFQFGTRPPEGEADGSMIKISSAVTSLLFLSVKGDIVEEGRIRDLAIKTISTDPGIPIEIRFENTGNVHVQPQGEIRVTDMFGRERSVIAVNQGTEFGNVLPGEIRRWPFEYRGNGSLLEIGRYRADLVLGFGEEARQTDSRSVHFWIIYPWPLIIGLGGIILLAALAVFGIRAYVRRAVAQTQRLMGVIAPRSPAARKISVIPQEHVVDLSASVTAKTALVSPSAKRRFFGTIAKVVATIVTIGGATAAFIWYKM